MGLVRMWWLCFIGIVFALIPAGIYLAVQNDCLRLNFSVQALRTEQERLAELERRLRLERSRLEALPVIEAWAADHELIRPITQSVFVLDSTTTATTGELLAGLPKSTACGKRCDATD